MYKSFELSESQTYDVDLFHRELGPLGRGRLSFGAEKMPQVTFRMTSPANSLSAVSYTHLTLPTIYSV